MSDTKLHTEDEGWTRTFWLRYDGAEDEAAAYVEGILDAGADQYVVEREYHDNRIEVVVKPKPSE